MLMCTHTAAPRPKFPHASLHALSHQRSLTRRARPPRSVKQSSLRSQPDAGPRASAEDSHPASQASSSKPESPVKPSIEESAPAFNPADPVKTIYWGGELPSRRRLLLGTGAATTLALGGNFLGVTSFLLGLNPEFAGQLNLDVVVPVNGFKRCVDAENGYEYLYPAEWLVDQRLVLRAARRAELERPLDPLSSREEARKQRLKTATEPQTGFGPAGGSGEENVSLIVAPIQPGFALEQFGSPEQAGTTLLSTIIAPAGSGKEATLLAGRSRVVEGNTYYIIEYTVTTPRWARHNFAVFAVRDNLLYTFNAQASKAEWPNFADRFEAMVDSFRLTAR